MCLFLRLGDTHAARIHSHPGIVVLWGLSPIKVSSIVLCCGGGTPLRVVNSVGQAASGPKSRNQGYQQTVNLLPPKGVQPRE